MAQGTWILEECAKNCKHKPNGSYEQIFWLTQRSIEKRRPAYKGVSCVPSSRCDLHTVIPGGSSTQSRDMRLRAFIPLFIATAAAATPLYSSSTSMDLASVYSR